MRTESVVWKLKKERYGRRIAGQAFVEWTAGHLKYLALERNPAAPWLFFNAKCAWMTSSPLDPTRRCWL